MNDIGEVEPNTMMIDSCYYINQFQSLSEKIKIRMHSKRPLKYIKLNRLDKDIDINIAFVELQAILAGFPQNKFIITYDRVFTPKMKDGVVIQHETISIMITWD